MRGRGRGSLVIGVSILLIPGERQGLSRGGDGLRQANRLRSCKAEVCLHDCRQALLGEGGELGKCAGKCAGPMRSRVLEKAQLTVIATNWPYRGEGEAILRIKSEVRC